MESNRVDQSNSRQYDIPMLDSLNKRVMHKWEDLLNYFNVEYYTSNTCAISNCGIHGGDNQTALNIYLEGCKSYAGNWKCNTQLCHEEFMPNIIGLTQGLLSRQQLGWSCSGDKKIEFKHTIDFLLNFLGTDYVSIQNTAENFGQNSSQAFTNQINKVFNRQVSEKKYKITRDEIRQKLKIPAQYYLDRGYSKEILNIYDVGLCDKPDQKMYNRVVVPIYDQHGNYVGCTGRTIVNDKRKWMHSSGLQSSEHLYNYYRAKDYIKKTQVMIITEGKGEDKKVEQCDNNS